MVSCALFTQNVMVMSALAMLANGLTVPDLTKRTDGVLKLDFDVVRNSTVSPGVSGLAKYPEADHILKRTTILPNPFSNTGVVYLFNFTLGSDQQPLKASLDTGSSDLWVPEVNANCATCKSHGSFNPETSTSFKDTGHLFNITYADTTSTLGELVTDVITIDGVTVDNFEFAIANESSVQNSGVFGISYNGQEAMSHNASNYTYTNFPALFKQEGIIAKNAYSLYLDNPAATSGSVIFGGIDHAKYEGTLAESYVALLPYQSIGWKGIQTANGSYIQGSGKPIVLDSGTTSSGFPPEIIEQIYAELNVDDDGLFLFAPCDQGGKNFTFELADGTISVPYQNFISPMAGTDCFLLDLSDTSAYKVDILGDIFLREAYVVYDLDDKTISYAQAVFNDESNIVPI